MFLDFFLNFFGLFLYLFIFKIRKKVDFIHRTKVPDDLVCVLAR